MAPLHSYRMQSKTARSEIVCWILNYSRTTLAKKVISQMFRKFAIFERTGWIIYQITVIRDSINHSVNVEILLRIWKQFLPLNGELASNEQATQWCTSNAALKPSDVRGKQHRDSTRVILLTVCNNLKINSKFKTMLYTTACLTIPLHF